MLATSQPQDTTPTALVEIPAISLPQWSDLVGRLLGAFPEAADRIQRGAQLAVSGTVYETRHVGVYRVVSCADPQTLYTTRSTGCDCPDAVRRVRACKHSFAVTLLSCASGIARVNRLNGERYTLTAKGEAALAAVR